MKHRDILIVEDDSGSRRALAALLNEEGYSVRQAADGQSALRIVADNPPGLIITDYKLPDLTAVEVIERASNCPVVVVSGAVKYANDRGPVGRFEDPGDEVLAAGAIAYLSKPVDSPRLLEVVGRVLA